MQQISSLSGTKLYYPFLRSVNGVSSPMRPHIDSILAYLLLVDVVVLPPRDVLAQDFLNTNQKAIKKDPKLLDALINGSVVFTASHSGADDIGRMVEAYSPGRFSVQEINESPVLLRDGSYQNEQYKLFIGRKISELTDILSEEKILLFDAIDRIQSHEGFVSSISETELSFVSKEAVSSIAIEGYRCGGAFGNTALMPPPTLDVSESFYNPFFSRPIAVWIVKRLEKIWRSNFAEIPAEKFQLLSQGLTIFHDLYRRYSEQHNDLNRRLFAAIQTQGTNWKFWSKLMTAMVGFAAGSLISTVINEDSITDFWRFQALNLAASVAFSMTEIAERITSIIFRQVKDKFPSAQNRYQIHRLLEEFDSTVRSTITTHT